MAACRPTWAGSGGAALPDGSALHFFVKSSVWLLRSAGDRAADPAPSRYDLIIRHA